MDNFIRVRVKEAEESPFSTMYRCLCLILLLIQCIILFGTENYNLKGQANYCTVKDSATEEELTLCAASKFDYTSSACMNVYADELDTSTNKSSHFNTILWFHLISSLLCCFPVVSIVLYVFSFILIFWRFSDIGKFCSGDFNPETYSDAPLSTKGSYINSFI